MTIQVIRLTLLTLLLAAVAACETTPSATTTVDRAAELPDNPNKPYQSVLVVAVAPRANTARDFEELLREELMRVGVTAYAYHRLAPTSKVTEEDVVRIVKDKDVDAVFMTTSHLVDTEVLRQEEHTDLESEVIGGSLIDYFRREYKEITTPPSASLQYNVHVVTDVYDTEMDQKVYTVESTTLHAETTYEIILQESRAIARRMRKDGVID